MVSNIERGIENFLPGLVHLRAYDRSWFGYDFLAGLSVAAVAVPIAIAYSHLAGFPPVHGLYASILPLVAYAFFGSSRQLIIAPDAATCAIVAATLTPLAAGNDSARYVSLSMILTIITGAFCIAAGVARLGFLTNFLARPILTGYLNGIALSIISGQLGTLFGFSLRPAGFFRLLFEFFSKLGETHYLTLTVGVAIFLALRLFKRLAPNIPAPLIAVVLGIAAASSFDLGRQGVALLGSIPAGLPPFMIPAFDPSDLGPLALGAVGLALISFNSAMVTARSFAVKNRYDIDSNQEFIALGVADIGAGLSQGFAVSGADSRTAINDYAGGKSQVTGLVAAAVLVLVLLFLTGPLSLLPVTVLAAVLINAAVSLFDLPSLLSLRQISRPEFRLSLVTSLGVITVGVLPGVLVAVALAIIQLLAKASRPNDAVLGRVPGVDGFHDVNGQPEAETLPGLIIYRFDSSLVFFNADYFKNRVRTVLGEAKTKPRWFLLDAESMPWMDTTGAAILDEVRNELSEKDIVLAVAEAKKPLRFMLDRSGLKERIGPDGFFPTLAAAVEAFRQIGNVDFRKA
ncbi:MAG: sulfate permease [Deltaproteobacteria bacterium]|nr:sulfate permease [Deltaproteobacteria bacterium]